MKLFLRISFTITALLAACTVAEARDYGVSSSSYGRGTKYTTERGGTAYVGPRGAAVQGAEGRTAVAGRRGAAYAGPNGAAVTGRYGGGAAVTANGSVYTRSSSTTVVASRTVVATPLPAGYVRVVPAGYTMVTYGGYRCYYVGGVYYRPVIYGGSTVYVVVR